MADLFIGEVLALLLLFPVAFRPFSRRLQKIGGLALFPLLSFLLCLATIGACGLRLSFMPVFALSLIALFSGAGRLFRLFRGLPTDWYSPSLVVMYGFFALLFAGVAGLTFYSAPETAYLSRQPVTRSASLKGVSPGVSARLYAWLPPAGTPEKGVVVFLGDVASRADSRSTICAVLSENGYRVNAADFSARGDYRNPLLASPELRGWLSLIARVFPGIGLPASAGEIDEAQSRDLDRLIRLANAAPGEPLFAVAEGSAADAVLSRMRAQPSLFEGAVLIVRKGYSSAPNVDPGMATVIEESSGSLPADAATKPLCVLTGSDRAYFGSGEIASDDVLAAMLSGSARDIGKKRAELLARRAASWISLKGGVR